jgi:hypothetical protein
MLASIKGTPFVCKKSAVAASVLTPVDRVTGSQVIAAIDRLQVGVGSSAFIRLRYRARCSVCGSALAPRTEALWDRRAKQATCRACVEPNVESPEAGAVVGNADYSVGGETLERGVPGASAARKYERLRGRREQRAHERFGRLGGVYLALSEEPQATRAWASGSAGERSLGRYLETVDDGRSVIVLHDRRIPGTRANIDHIAVTAGGIYVIDAKNYSGKVRHVDRGGFLTSDWRLYVGRRDCTSLASAMEKQVASIRDAVGQPWLEEFGLSIRPVLCFVAAEWPLLARPFELGGVWIGWAKALRRRLRAPGPLTPEHVRLVAERLAGALPAA